MNNDGDIVDDVNDDDEDDVDDYYYHYSRTCFKRPPVGQCQTGR